MPSNHLILYCPLLLLISIFPSIRVFSSESAYLIWWPKYWGSASASVLPHFIFLASKINMDSDCSHKIKRRLLLGRKAMTNLNSILQSRDITWLTKVHIVKAMVFPVVMYRCESWNIEKAEHQRTDAFELWCWRRLLRVPWTARSSN